MPDRASQFDQAFREDLAHWIAVQPGLAARLMDVVEAVLRDPFRGIGKPEPLKHRGPNIWSRRLNDEHRVVYRVEPERVVFLRARGHYEG